MPSHPLASLIVRLHDQEGFPAELSLRMAVERGFRMPLLALCLEVSRRRLGKRAMREIACEWARHFTPTPAETRAIAALGIA